MSQSKCKFSQCKYSALYNVYIIQCIHTCSTLFTFKCVTVVFTMCLDKRFPVMTQCVYVCECEQCVSLSKGVPPWLSLLSLSNPPFPLHKPPSSLLLHVPFTLHSLSHCNYPGFINRRPVRTHISLSLYFDHIPTQWLQAREGKACMCPWCQLFVCFLWLCLGQQLGR